MTKEMDVVSFKEKIRRTYRVLGLSGECQNITDIEGWYEDGLISEDECVELKEYNRELANEY